MSLTRKKVIALLEDLADTAGFVGQHLEVMAQKLRLDDPPGKMQPGEADGFDDKQQARGKDLWYKSGWNIICGDQGFDRPLPEGLDPDTLEYLSWIHNARPHQEIPTP